MNTQENIDAKLIAQTIYNKSVRSFKYRRSELLKQVKYFTPEYFDFLYKIVKNNSLKIKLSYESYLIPYRSFQQNSYRKRAKNTVMVDINDLDAMPHELGHAVDFWFGLGRSFSTKVLLSNGRTLQDIFEKEFKDNQQE